MQLNDFIESATRSIIKKDKEIDYNDLFDINQCKKKTCHNASLYDMAITFMVEYENQRKNIEKEDSEWSKLFVKEFEQDKNLIYKVIELHNKYNGYDFVDVLNYIPKNFEENRKFALSTVKIHNLIQIIIYRIENAYRRFFPHGMNPMDFNIEYARYNGQSNEHIKNFVKEINILWNTITFEYAKEFSMRFDGVLKRTKQAYENEVILERGYGREVEVKENKKTEKKFNENDYCDLGIKPIKKTICTVWSNSSLDKIKEVKAPPSTGRFVNAVFGSKKKKNKSEEETTSEEKEEKEEKKEKQYIYISESESEKEDNEWTSIKKKKNKKVLNPNYKEEIVNNEDNIVEENNEEKNEEDWSNMI